MPANSRWDLIRGLKSQFHLAVVLPVTPGAGMLHTGGLSAA